MTWSYSCCFFSSTFPHIFGPTSSSFPLFLVLSPSVVILHARSLSFPPLPLSESHLSAGCSALL